MSTYKPKRKTSTSGTMEELKFPISSIDGLQTALDGKLDKSGGTVTGNVTITNGSSTQAKEPSLKWKTVGGNTPYVGFATDQVDGTFLVGSLKGTDYRTGLAIGGGSGNLLWKGARVPTADDLSSLQPKADNTLKTTAKTVAGAINEVNNKTLDRLTNINFDTPSVSDIRYSDTIRGIAWKVPNAGIVYKDTDGKSYSPNFAATQKAPIVAGKGVEFEVDTTNQIVKINGSGTTMPQIRFCSAKYDGPYGYVTDTRPMTLTIEIVGGGVLQVGDRLQVCVRRKYNYAVGGDHREGTFSKWKLRRREEYVITEEDLNKRFLSIPVYRTSQCGPDWLFKNDRCMAGSMNTLSPFYMRIKRVTKYSENGAEADAIFSNVLTLWKTMNLNDGYVTIK